MMQSLKMGNQNACLQNGSSSSSRESTTSLVDAGTQTNFCLQNGSSSSRNSMTNDSKDAIIEKLKLDLERCKTDHEALVHRCEELAVFGQQQL